MKPNISKKITQEKPNLSEYSIGKGQITFVSNWAKAKWKNTAFGDSFWFGTNMLARVCENPIDGYINLLHCHRTNRHNKKMVELYVIDLLSSYQDPSDLLVKSYCNLINKTNIRNLFALYLIVQNIKIGKNAEEIESLNDFESVFKGQLQKAINAWTQEGFPVHIIGNIKDIENIKDIDDLDKLEIKEKDANGICFFFNKQFLATNIANSLDKALIVSFLGEYICKSRIIDPDRCIRDWQQLESYFLFFQKNKRMKFIDNCLRILIDDVLYTLVDHKMDTTSKQSAFIFLNELLERGLLSENIKKKLALKCISIYKKFNYREIIKDQEAAILDLIHLLIELKVLDVQKVLELFPTDELSIHEINFLFNCIVRDIDLTNCIQEKEESILTHFEKIAIIGKEARLIFLFIYHLIDKNLISEKGLKKINSIIFSSHLHHAIYSKDFFKSLTIKFIEESLRRGSHSKAILQEKLSYILEGFESIDLSEHFDFYQKLFTEGMISKENIEKLRPNLIAFYRTDIRAFWFFLILFNNKLIQLHDIKALIHQTNPRHIFDFINTNDFLSDTKTELMRGAFIPLMCAFRMSENTEKFCLALLDKVICEKDKNYDFSEFFNLFVEISSLITKCIKQEREFDILIEFFKRLIRANLIKEIPLVIIKSREEFLKSLDGPIEQSRINNEAALHASNITLWSKLINSKGLILSMCVFLVLILAHSKGVFSSCLQAD